jgi:hypothetical protein
MFNFGDILKLFFPLSLCSDLVLHSGKEYEQKEKGKLKGSNEERKK